MWSEVVLSDDTHLEPRAADADEHQSAKETRHTMHEGHSSSKEGGRKRKKERRTSKAIAETTLSAKAVRPARFRSLSLQRRTSKQITACRPPRCERATAGRRKSSEEEKKRIRTRNAILAPGLPLSDAGVRASDGRHPRAAGCVCSCRRCCAGEL